MVIFESGTGLSARAALPPQVSCSVHGVLASHMAFQGLQQEGGLIHPEKPTAKREGGHQVGEISGRIQRPHMHPQKCLRYNIQLPNPS